MFSALRQGTTLYVLDKKNLTLNVCEVLSVPPMQSYGNMPWMAGAQQPVDVTVRFEDGTQGEFKQMQPHQSVAVYGNVVVTDTKEMMAQEVDTMERNAKQVIDSVAFNQKILEASSSMKARLSPSFAKEQETDKRLMSLEQGLVEIKNLIVGKMGASSSN